MNNINQVCPQCGTQLAAGQMFCNNCGRHLETGGVDPTQRASNTGSPSNPGYGQQVGPTQYAGGNPSQYEYTNYGGGQAPPPPPGGSGYEIPSSTPYPSQTSYPSAPTYPSQTGYPSSGGGFPPPGGFPPQKQGPNVGLIVGIIALIVVVVGGGLFWAYGRGGGGTTQVTPTPSSTTPTVAPTPTPAALFSDTFDDNHNNWDLGSSASYTISLSGGSLRLKEINPDKIVRAPFVQQPPTDATINMTFTLSTAGQNDMMGLLMRGSGASNLFGYYIDVYGDNSYDIQRYYQDPADSTKGKVEYLLDSTTTGIKPKGQENQMSVVIKGSSISLTVNGQFVKTVTDTSNSFPSGRTYFFVQSASTTNGVEGAFSSLDIYPAPANLPS